MDVSKGISSSVRRKLSLLLENLKKDPNFSIFIEPIDPIRDGCIDYFEVIKNPVDLKTISNRLIDDKYKNIMEFYDDIMLIFSNCREYNTSPLCAQLIDLCNKSEKRFLAEWNKLGFLDKSNKRRLYSKGNNSNLSNKDLNTIKNNQTSSLIQGVKVTSDSSKSNKKNNLNRVLLKIEKDNTLINTEQNNKRNKNESKKNFQIPLKRRKEEHLDDLVNKNNKSNENSVINNTQNDDWKMECLRILNLLRKEDNSFLFENPVLESNDLTEETKVRYKEIVSEACDYSTIEKRLLNNKKNNRKRHNLKNVEYIDNPHEFERLIKLVFSNCMLFNPNTGDCKWIYDSARQSLNRFNNIWSKSNVFSLYFNYSNNYKDTRDNYSDTSIGLSIGNSNNNINRHYHYERNCDMNIQNKVISFKSKNIYNISSFNKIITQWNNYSILWRQFILNNNSKVDKNNLCKKLKSNEKFTNNIKDHEMNCRSSINSKKRISFNMPFSKNKILDLEYNVEMNKYFDFNENKDFDIDNSNFKFKINESSVDKLKIDQLADLNSNDLIEYIIPLKIYGIDTMNSNLSILQIIDNISYHCHRYEININKESNIYIYCFQPYEQYEYEYNYNNIIRNYNFLAFTNDYYLNNKYIELKIVLSKSSNNIFVPLTNQYMLCKFLISNVKIVVKSFIYDTNAKLNINFGKILNL